MHGAGTNALATATSFPLVSVPFPYPEPGMNSSAMDDDVIGFVKRWFGTQEVAFRPGGTLVRYPSKGDEVPAAPPPVSKNDEFCINEREIVYQKRGILH